MGILSTLASEPDVEMEDDFTMGDMPLGTATPEAKLQYVKAAVQRASVLRDKADRAAASMRDYRSPNQTANTLMTIGGALLSPTRTGTLGETFGNVGRAVGALGATREAENRALRQAEADALAKRYERAASTEEDLAALAAKSAFAQPRNPSTANIVVAPPAYPGATPLAYEKGVGPDGKPFVRAVDIGGAPTSPTTDDGLFEDETRNGVLGKKNRLTKEWEPYPKDAQPGAKSTAVLPVALQKVEDADLEAIGALSGIRSDIRSAIQQIDSGALNLSLMGNISNRAKSALGVGDENTAAFDTFKSTLETMRNASLLLAKGVQTEGDAQRAWSALMSNLSSEKVVKAQLERIEKINERSAKLKSDVLQRRRANRGLPPLDLADFTDLPSSLGKAPAEKTSERPPLTSFMRK